MPGTVSSLLPQLERRRDEIRGTCERLLLSARAAGRETLNGREAARYREAEQDLRGIEEHIADLREDEARSGIPAKYAKLRRDGSRSGRGGREFRSAGAVSPLGYSDETLRRAHTALAGGSTAVLEARAFNSAVGLLPAELYPVPTFPRHEARLMDRLPGFALDAPSLEYVQVTSVTGAAAIVGEGQLKPEIVAPPTKQIVTALKLACHGGVSWENIQDYDSFTAAVQNELL